MLFIYYIFTRISFAHDEEIFLDGKKDFTLYYEV